MFVLAAAVVGLGAYYALTRDDGTAGPSLRELVGNIDPGPIHVHGLGVNPADRSLFIATHTGMFRVEDGETKAERVTNRSQDTMGFTIVGPDRFLGSGHPDINEARAKGLPGLLGLIESRDAGRTWQPISLLGEADFHVLRSMGKRVYGYDATNDRLMFSRDAGRTWAQRRPPAPLADLAVDPGGLPHLVASGGSVLFESFDEGRSWRVRSARAGLLAWPTREELYLVDGTGEFFVSADRGSRWKRLGDIGGEPAALLADGDLYVALHDGTIKRSRDGGRSWTVRSTP
jgi:photosystem II stability/assembly factor-like uncharacterized protein